MCKNDDSRVPRRKAHVGSSAVFSASLAGLPSTGYTLRPPEPPHSAGLRSASSLKVGVCSRSSPFFGPRGGSCGAPNVGGASRSSVSPWLGSVHAPLLQLFTHVADRPNCQWMLLIELTSLSFDPTRYHNVPGPRAARNTTQIHS